ncbi:MAG: hypothetical protein R3D98_13255 [Candidatus Krumholzibacteriia bacterium]
MSGDGQSVLAVDYTYGEQDHNDDGGPDVPDTFEVHRIAFGGALPNITPFA